MNQAILVGTELGLELRREPPAGSTDLMIAMPVN